MNDDLPILYSYDANDRLLSAGAVSYTYDANGNTRTATQGGDTTTYHYDARNRLVEAVTPTDTLSFEYDEAGNRVRKSVGAVTTHFLIDENREFVQVLEEQDETGLPQRAYTYGSDLISQEQSGLTSYHLHDSLGSVRVFNNAQEATLETYEYDVFGESLDLLGPNQNRYLFAGEQYDEHLGMY